MNATPLLKETILSSMVSTKFLELILLPTEQCNFRCTYCYEDFTVGKMSRDTIDGIKNLITKRASELEIIKLTWFGGEPLSAKEIVYEISDFTRNIAKENNIIYQSSMTTNGFLLNRKVVEKTKYLWN